MRKTLVTKGLLFPLLLRFCVRIFCYYTIFTAYYITTSQTTFLYPDSAAFVSEDSFLYVETPVDIPSVKYFSGKSLTSSKQLNANKRKVFFKPKSLSINKSNVNKSNQASFTASKSSHYVVKTNNTLSTVVLGDPSIKQSHKMAGYDFWILPTVIVSEKKLLYMLTNHMNLSRTITNHFSQPPPY